MKPWRSRWGFWIALGFVLWLVLLSEVPASEREQPLLELAVVLWPLFLVWRLLQGLGGDLLQSLPCRLPYVVASGTAYWGLWLLVSDWNPPLREDFGILTPGFVAKEALLAFPLTWMLLLSLIFWRARWLVSKRLRESAFGASRVVLFLWAWEVMRNLEVWFSASGNHLPFLWLNIAAAAVPFSFCLALLSLHPRRATGEAGYLPDGLPSVGAWSAALSVLFASAGLVALMERTTYEPVFQELEELRGAVLGCHEMERQPTERSPCGGVE